MHHEGKVMCGDPGGQNKELKVEYQVSGGHPAGKARKWPREEWQVAPQ